MDMISLTETAAKEIKKVMQSELKDPESVCIRIGVKAGGCSGFTYVMDFDDTKRRHDLLFQSEGMCVLVDKKSYLFIKDTVIDWSYELAKRGLRFENPAAKMSCGCRISFQVDMPEQEEPVFKPTW